MMQAMVNRWIHGPLCGFLLVAAAAVQAESIRETVTFESLVGDSIQAVLSVPSGATPASLFPACLVLHGSGGLYDAGAPGAACGSTVESNFDRLIDTFEKLGIVVLAPDSFSSRDERFCEDNEDAYFQFVPPPFHNPGDGALDREGKAYKSRRIETRVLDAGAALKYLQDMPNVDDSRICVVGASNGGSTALVLSNNATGRHAVQFADKNTARPNERSDDFDERRVFFANYPVLPPGTEGLFDSLPVIRFTQAISPGCFLRKMIPVHDPENVSVLEYPKDFLHPEDARDGYVGTSLYVEIGGDDGVPGECRSDGIRHIQATAYQNVFNVVPPRWLPTVYPGYGHNLIRDNPDILGKTKDLAIDHFYRIFRDGME